MICPTRACSSADARAATSGGVPRMPRMNVSWASLPIAQKRRSERSAVSNRNGVPRGVSHGRRLVRPRCVRRWDEQHQRGGAVRVAQRELQRRRPAGGSPEDRGARDVQRVEETGVRVGLRGGRRVFGQRRAQIAEARHRDHAKAAARERLGELEAPGRTRRPPRAPTRAAVPRPPRRTRSARSESARILAAGCDAVVGAADVAPVARIGQREAPR